MEETSMNQAASQPENLAQSSQENEQPQSVYPDDPKEYPYEVDLDSTVNRR